jgi:hypothetical protein
MAVHLILEETVTAETAAQAVAVDQITVLPDQVMQEDTAQSKDMPAVLAAVLPVAAQVAAVAAQAQ